MELKDLGFTQQQLREQLLDRLVEGVLTNGVTDEDGMVTMSFEQTLKNEMNSRIDEAVAKIGLEYVLPEFEQGIEKMVLQRTTSWGEPDGDPLTFTEYMIAAAHRYMLEQVDENGRSKGKDEYRNFRPVTTRLAFMLDKKLQSGIDMAVSKVLAEGNSTMAEALLETCKIRMTEMVSRIKVATKV